MDNTRDSTRIGDAFAVFIREVDALLARLAGQEGGVSSCGSCVDTDRLLAHQPPFECLIHQ